MDLHPFRVPEHKVCGRKNHSLPIPPTVPILAPRLAGGLQVFFWYFW